MPERHFIPASLLETYALYQIPYGRTFVIKCQSCGVLKEIDRRSLDKLPQMASLKELSPRFLCTLCGEKNARIMAGGWANGATKG
jgi:Zn finger protein HypA/HybF involved in hydrogenase expression